MRFFLLFFLFLNFCFDSEARIVYTDPVADAKFVSTENNIIIGCDQIISSTDLNTVLRVTGSKSGIHTGEFIFTEDRKRLIFKPHQAFEFDETVEIKIYDLKTTNGSETSLTYTFETQVEKTKNPVDFYHEYYDPSGNIFTGTDSNSIMPPLSVTISNNPSPGRIFLSNYKNTDYSDAYLIIANNDGSTHYSQFVADNSPDFKRQPNGLMTYFDVEHQIHYGLNAQYNIVDSFSCGNGYPTNQHDLKVLNNGHALVMSYDRQQMDMSLIYPGGHPEATVIGLIIQEIDENKNVIFQWRSWDHFLITDAQNINLTFRTVDYCHGNAIEEDNDGNLMISSRHLNEITKIDRHTGEMIWRMGGANNQFTFINDTVQFSFQHDIRRISNGNITLYDNGNFRTPLYSRALEYHLDEVNKVATLVWEYRNDPDIHGPNRGSVQRLKNGNTLIGWGGTNPTLTEVTQSGEIALEMTFPFRTYSYRAFKDEVHLTLNVNLAIEGHYDPQTNSLNLKDTVKAYLRDGNSPFAIVDSSQSIVDSVQLRANFRFYNAPTGTYYLSLTHRNGLETWSSSELDLQTLTSVFSYDFTDLRSKAYGYNLVLKGSKFCIYSGDVEQDGIIDLNDVNLIYNDAGIFNAGYISTDLNGDYTVDLEDVIIAGNNSNNFIGLRRP